MVGRISRWSRMAHHLVRTDIDTDRGSTGDFGTLGLGWCVPQACLTRSRLTQLFRVIVNQFSSPMGPEQEVMTMAKRLLAALLILQARFAVSLHYSPGQRRDIELIEPGHGGPKRYGVLLQT